MLAETESTEETKGQVLRLRKAETELKTRDTLPLLWLLVSGFSIAHPLCLSTCIIPSMMRISRENVKKSKVFLTTMLSGIFVTAGIWSIQAQTRLAHRALSEQHLAHRWFAEVPRGFSEFLAVLQSQAFQGLRAIGCSMTLVT